MTTSNRALKGTPNSGAAHLPPKQNEESEAAVTTSLVNVNPAGEHEPITRGECNTSSAAVDPGTGARVRCRLDDKTNIEKKMTTRAPDEDPNSNPKAAAENSESQNKTADELMEEHVGEVPKAEKKFSLASLKSKSEEAVPKSNTKPGTITVGKPLDDAFIRTSANPEEWAAFDFIELKSDNKKLYLLTPGVVEEIHALNEDRAQVMIKTMKKRLIYSVTRLGEPFLWPITIMDDNDWIDSANTCAEAAKEDWLRVVSNINARRYDYVTSPSTTEPKWPAMTYEEAVLKAFDGKVIDSMGHDVIEQLLGED